MIKPTKEQALNEPAGPRIDGWFAEFVMKWHKRELPRTIINGGNYLVWTEPGIDIDEFNPSTNISHAIMGVEKYKHLGIELVWCEDIKNWSVWFGGRNVLDYIYANTLELAITRALIL